MSSVYSGFVVTQSLRASLRKYRTNKFTATFHFSFATYPASIRSNSKLDELYGRLIRSAIAFSDNKH